MLGNANYSRGDAADGGALPTAMLDDTRALAAALERVGFSVATVLDATRAQMRGAVTSLSKRLGADPEASDSVGLVYYAGHGLQLEGANYLLPVDFRATSGDDALARKAVSISWVLEKMQATPALTSILFVDACRHAASDGLAAVAAPSGALVALSSAPGRPCWRGPAADGDQADAARGVYARELLAALDDETLAIEDLHLERVLKRTRRRVANATGNEQIPWESSSLLADVVLVRPLAGAASAEAGRATRDTEEL